MSARTGRRPGVVFTIGVALIASSFAVYPAYPVIALLALPLDLRIALAVAASALSWGIFLLGTGLAGKRGVNYLKRLVTRGKAPPPI